MKKLALVFAAIILTLSILATPVHALDDDFSETATPEISESCDAATGDSVCETDDDGEDNPPDANSSRNLIISEIAARICADATTDCDSAAQKAGAFVEVYNDSDEAFTLSGWKIYYATATATHNYAPDGQTWLADVAPDIAPHAYAAFAGAVGNATDGYVILTDETGATVDIVGYGKAAQAAIKLSPKLNQSLQRCELADATLDGFALYPTPTPNAGVICDDEADDDSAVFANSAPVNNCDGLMLSEIGANLATQFIEIQNVSANDLDITGCEIMTNRSATKFFAFASEVLPAGNFAVVNISDTDLTLTKTTTGTVYLLNSDGSVEIDSVDYANLKAGTSFAKIAGIWQQTFAPTPGSANLAQLLTAAGMEMGVLDNAG